MIKYDFGIECEISWDKFLCIETKHGKIYKKDFKDFSDFYYFLDTNKERTTNVLFDGYEYVVENGLLHNLYGPAKLKHTEKSEGTYFPGTVKWFFINGKMVSEQQEKKRGCRSEEIFESGDIFFYEEITNKKSGKQEDGTYYRRKEGIDYIKHNIDLEKLRQKDIRKKKLEQINEMD